MIRSIDLNLYRHARREVGAASRSRAERCPSRARSGFTLVEMLVTVGIIILLIGVLLPVLARVRRQGDRARTGMDLSVIAQGLEAYKGDFGDYPRDTAWNANPPGYNDVVKGSFLLGFALVAPGKAAEDGADGPGFRTRSYLVNGVVTGVGKTYIYLDPSRFFGIGASMGTNYSQSQPLATSNGYVIPDRNGIPILYFPANKHPAPLSTMVMDKSSNQTYGAYLGGPNVNAPTRLALYDWYTSTHPWFATLAKNPPPTWQQMAVMFGNFSLTGTVGGSSMSFAPDNAMAPNNGFVLWAAGPDKQYGPQAFGNDPSGVHTSSSDPGSFPARNAQERTVCDDVMNFTDH